MATTQNANPNNFVSPPHSATAATLGKLPQGNNSTANASRNPLVSPSKAQVSTEVPAQHTQPILGHLNVGNPVINTQPTYSNANPAQVFGPLYNGQNAQEASQVLQITGGLTLPQIFNLLKQYNINLNGAQNVNVSVQGNKIVITYNSKSYLGALSPINTGQYVGYINNNYTIEIENINGWTVVKYKNYQTGQYMNSQLAPTLSENYYVINPYTSQIVWTGPGINTAVVWNQPIMSASNAINGALSQFGYSLSYSALQQVANLQPGQSTTVYATGNPSAGNPYGAQLKITNLGNGQYQIQSTTPLYDNGQWLNINETVNIPMATENILSGSVSAGSYNIKGTATLLSSGSSNATTLATYSINETFPITTTTSGNQVTFQTGSPQGGISLQSTNVPTLTTQQYQELQQGQMPSGLKPGWYYYPQTGQFIYVPQPQYVLTVGNTQITNQQVVNFVQQYGSDNVYVVNMPGNSNELAFIYLNSNGNGQMLIYNTSTGQVVNTISISNLNAGNSAYNQLVQAVYSQIYPQASTDTATATQAVTSTTTVSQASATSSNNTLNLNYQQLANEVLYGTSNVTSQASNSANANLQSVLYGSSSPTNAQIQIVSPNSITGISGSLYYQQLIQQISNNPTYPYNTSTVKIRNLTVNTLPAITDTTATYTQMNAMNTINQVKNVQAGIRTYEFLADVSSLLGAKTTAQYYQTLAQQAQVYGSPSFYQAEQLGQTERLTAATIAASMPLTIAGIGLSLAGVGAEIGAEGATAIGAGEIGSSILPRVTLSTALTRIGINAAIGAAENVASGEIMSYALTGKPLPAQQALQLAAEGAGIGAITGGISLFSTSPNAILASLGTQFTPLNFAKNLGITIAGNLISGNVVSYLSSGKPLTLQQDIYSIEEAGPATLAFSTVLGVLENPSISNSFLSLVTSPNSSKYWPIIARVGYDVGANFLAGTSASLAAQGVGNAIGAQQGINVEEAIGSGLTAALFTFGFEGFSAFRNPGAFVKSFGYYPQKFELLDITPTRVDQENMIVWLHGKGNEILYPQLGNRVYTEQDFGNIKAMKLPFDVTGYLQAIRMPGEEAEGEEINQGFERIKYTGRFKISSGENTIITTPEGFIKLTKTPIETFEQYLTNTQALANDIASVRPEFSELANVPPQGTYLFAKATEGNLIETVERLNQGQTIAQIEGEKVYRSGELETYISPNSWNKNIGPFPNARELDWRFPLSYLQTGEYNLLLVRPFYNLPETSGEFALEIAPGVYRIANYQIPSGIEPTGYETIFEGPEGYLTYKYKVPTRFNVNNNLNGMVVWQEEGVVPTSLGKTYKGYSYGISATYETGEAEGTYVSSIGTSAGILKEQGAKKFWGLVSQGGTVTMRDTLYRTPEGELQNIQFGFGYTKGIDPDQEYQTALQMLQRMQKAGSGMEISSSDITTVLQNIARQKIAMPVQSYGTINAYTNYGFPIVTMNNAGQKVIRINNNNNIKMNTPSGLSQQINQEYIQIQTSNEKPLFNEFNIQNGSSIIRENLNEEISGLSGWSGRSSVPVPKTKPLKNYGKDLYNGIQNPESQENTIRSKIKPLDLGKSLLRSGGRIKTYEREESNIKAILPELNLLAVDIYKEQTVKPIVTTTTITKTGTTTPPTVPPTTPPVIPPIGWPEITIMGQPIRGLAPGLSRGVRSMYDIQYALSRLQW